MRIGFIGAGNMAQAIFHSLLKSRLFTPQEVYISDIRPDLLQELGQALGIHTTQDNVQLVQSVDIIVLAVKPIFAQDVVSEIAGAVGERAVLSVVSGLTTHRMTQLFPKRTHLLRVMPNTPALVGEGIFLLSAEHTFDADFFAQSQQMFASMGKVFVLAERLFDAATAVSGCGPAYCFEIMEAMADAGVMNGLPRDLSYQLAAQTLIGAGTMLRDTGSHPGALKDAVCSPGGSTIRGIYSLEQSGVRGAMMQVVNAAFEATQAQTRQQNDKALEE